MIGNIIPFHAKELVSPAWLHIMKVLSNGGALLPSRGEAIAMMKVVLTVTARLLFGREPWWCQTLIRLLAWPRCSVLCQAFRKPCSWPRWEPSVFWRWSSRWSFSGQRSQGNKKGIVPQFGDWDGALFLMFNWSKALSVTTGLGAVMASSPFIYVFIIVGHWLPIKHREPAENH